MRIKPFSGGMLAICGAGALCGCSTAKEEIRPTSAKVVESSSVTSDAPQAERDPIGYLRKVQRRCAQMEQYTLTFTRQERRGLLPQLTPPERIACWFRKQPFSVRMKWLDANVKYGESTFVQGQHDDKIRYVPRHGLLGLPPTINEIDVQTPVAWGEAKRPVTDFGLENMLNRALATYDSDPGDAHVEYLGASTLLDPPRPVLGIRITYRHIRPDTPVQEMYLDPATSLPVCAILKRPDGTLDSAYVYENIEASVHLTDEDFRLEFERNRDASAPATTSHPVSAAPASQPR